MKKIIIILLCSLCIPVSSCYDEANEKKNQDSQTVSQTSLDSIVDEKDYSQDSRFRLTTYSKENKISGTNESTVRIPIEISAKKIEQTLKDGLQKSLMKGQQKFPVNVMVQNTVDIIEKVESWVDAVEANYVTRVITMPIVVPAKAAVWGNRIVERTITTIVPTRIYYPCVKTCKRTIRIFRYKKRIKYPCVRICSKKIPVVSDFLEHYTERYLISPAKAAYTKLVEITETVLLSPAKAGFWMTKEIVKASGEIIKPLNITAVLNYEVILENFTFNTLGSDAVGCKLANTARIKTKISADLTTSLPKGWILSKAIKTITESVSVFEMSINGSIGINKEAELMYVPEKGFKVRALKIHDVSLLSLLVSPQNIIFNDGKSVAYLFNLVNDSKWLDGLDNLIDNEIKKVCAENTLDIKPMIDEALEKLREDYIPIEMVDTTFLNQPSKAWLSFVTEKTNDQNQMKLKTYLSPLKGDNNILSTSVGIGGNPVITFGSKAPVKPTAVEHTFVLSEWDNTFNIVVEGRIELGLIESYLQEAWGLSGLKGAIPSNTFLPYPDLLNTETIKSIILDKAELYMNRQLVDRGLILNKEVYFKKIIKGIEVNTKVKWIGFVDGLAIVDGYLIFNFGGEGKFYGDKGEDSSINLDPFQI